MCCMLCMHIVNLSVPYCRYISCKSLIFLNLDCYVQITQARRNHFNNIVVVNLVTLKSALAVVQCVYALTHYYLGIEMKGQCTTCVT